MTNAKKSQPALLAHGRQLKKLTVEQVEQIDELLSLLGEYGEIHLIVQRGVLKYINKVESHKAWDEDKQE
ncbi:MAG TPA: hypothetical protein VJ821_03695 [Anaerolineales bacterium]|nr:hypothetical protein [Anaerolineales bacterium]